MRSSRVTEVNVLEFDVSLRSFEVELVSRRILSIDVGTRVDEMNESLSTSSRFRHVGYEREDVSCLDRTKDDTAEESRPESVSVKKRFSPDATDLIIATKKSR